MVTLEEFYFASQIASSVAVVGSLFYLATQVREQNRESRRRAVADLTQNLGNHQLSIAADGELVALWLKGIYHFADMDSVEKTRFAFMFNQGFRIWESLYLDHLEGRLNAEMFTTYVAPIDRAVTLPGVQAWWADRRWWYQPSFQRFVDEKVAAAQSVGIRTNTWPEWQTND